MTKLQYFSHKLGLAINSGNKDLQHFYAHEVEEQSQRQFIKVERRTDNPYMQSFE